MTQQLYYVYFLTGRNNKVLYIGRTENLLKRLEQHQSKSVKGFTAKYNLSKLVYYEVFEDKLEAAEREYKFKRWRREWKNNLIEIMNPKWDDLSVNLHQGIPDMAAPFRDVS